jgi:hypothetical protein
MSDNQYAPAVGNKFYEDGSIRQFPGNTVICFADPQSQVYQEAEWVQQQLQHAPYADKFAMLPPSSFHMTVFELICDQVRDPEKWSSQLSLGAPLEETDRYFMETVATVTPPTNFRMTFAQLNVGETGLSLRLQPADDETKTAIRQYRDNLAEATGIRFPDHETYAFHLSLAYRIIVLNDDEAQQLAQLAERINQQLSETFGVFDTGQPTLTFFNDMFAFVPIDERHTLASRSS